MRCRGERLGEVRESSRTELVHAGGGSVRGMRTYRGRWTGRGMGTYPRAMDPEHEPRTARHDMYMNMKSSQVMR